MIRSSDTVEELAKALVGIQAAMAPVAKKAENPFFKSKYADLASIVEQATPIATANGLAVTQMIGFDGEHDTLTTRLMHISGQWQEDTMRLFLVKQDPQGQGSATTYARRYAYCSALGIVTEVDDDGNAASKAPAQTPVRRDAPVQRSQPGAVHNDTGELASTKQLGMIAGLFKEKGFIDDREVRHNYIRIIIERNFESSKELTKSEASKVITALQAEAADAPSDLPQDEQPF